MVPEVALRKKTSWAWASMMRLRVPTVSGEMSMVGSLFSADSTVSLMWPNAPLASWIVRRIMRERDENLLPRLELTKSAIVRTTKTVLAE